MIAFARDGASITARFTRVEASVLADLCTQLVAMLEQRESADAAGDMLYAQLGIGGSSTPPLDPALARLLPDAYRGDDEAASDHRRLTERGLVDRKIVNARAVIASLATKSITLDNAAVQSWLRTLTDLRLVIAARLQIEDDDDEGVGDENMLMLYDWLGYLQGTLLEALDD